MKIVVCLALSLCAVAAPLAAQDGVIPTKLSLAEALRLADERNPVLASARAVAAMAGADVVTARTRPNPELSAGSEGYALFGADRPGFWNGQEFSLRVDQEIEMGGRLRLRTESAEAGKRSAQASFEDERRRLRFDVRRAYLQLALARADQAAAKTSLEEIDRVIAMNRARLEQGEISGGEMRRIQVERLRFMDDAFGADLAVRNATSALLALLNAPRLDQDVEVTDTLMPLAAGDRRDAGPTGSPADRRDAGPTGVAGSSLVSSGTGVSPVTTGVSPIAASDALAREALANRADLAAAREDQSRADAETRLQRALKTPNLVVGGGYKRNFGDNGLIVGLSIPLPVFDRNAGGQARAEAGRQVAASRVEATRLAVALEVQQAANAIAINRARVEYIERESLGYAREARDIVLTSYNAGAADLLDFLDAQRALRETQRLYSRALYDYRVSLFQLDAAVGR
jgi:cobalt-zinc-cadmium efflux system outer membrane protein